MPGIGLLSQAVKTVPSFAEGLAEAAKSKTVANAIKGNPAEAFAVKPWEQGKVHTYLAGHAKSGALMNWLLMDNQKRANFFDASTQAALGSMTPEEQQALAQRFEEDPHALREIGQSAQLGGGMGALGGALVGGLAGVGAGQVAHAGISGLMHRPYNPKMWPALLGALLVGGGGAYLGTRFGRDEERSKALLRENALANEESKVRKLLSQYYQSVRQGEPASGEPDEADARYAAEAIIDRKLAPYRDPKEFPAPEEHSGVPRFQDPREDQEKTSEVRDLLIEFYMQEKLAGGSNILKSLAKSLVRFTAEQTLAKMRAAEALAAPQAVQSPSFWTPTRKLLAGAGALGGGAYLLNRSMSQPAQNTQPAYGYPQGYSQGYPAYQ